MSMGLDEEVREEAGTEIVSIDEAKKKRQPFAYWEVGGRLYRMKLNTSAICRIEDKYKCNLMGLLSRYGDLPPLNVMLTIAQGAMMPWEHGMKYERVLQLFDQYMEEGGTQTTFLMDVIIPLYQVSGFFSADQQESMDRRLGEVKTLM